MDEIYFHETRAMYNMNDDEIHYRAKREQINKPGKPRTKGVGTTACITVIAIAFFLAGISLGFWTCNLKRAIEKADEKNEIAKKNNEDPIHLHQNIAEQIERNEIEKHLRKFTKYPHSAGSLQNRKLALLIQEKWQNEYGIETELVRYNVLLSFPSKLNRSAVHLIDSKNNVKFTTQRKEKVLEESEKQGNVLPTFAAYSPSGNITSDIIYVNYGTDEDFQYLLEHNVSCEGKLVIVRYGKNFRGDKVRLAYDHGALGVIVYNDPADFAPGPNTYPHSKYLPCTGVQLGAFRVANGDPETPGYPSKEGINRIAKNKQSLPKLPVYPVSACDALEFLSKLRKVIPTPFAWQGGLNISYHIGPGFQETYKEWKVRLEVYNEEKREDIYNVVGRIQGKQEPDRRVIIGNHRDAWVFGGVDPSGGTACLMEIARVLGQAMKDGWRPRRTIMIVSWGGEEYGMIGSTEYVEEFSQSLREEAVAYLNIDSPVRGNYSMFAKSSPMLYDVLYEATKKVKSPVNQHETVFDQWLRGLPSRDYTPRVDNIATGSDFVAFNQQLGIPSAEIRYIAGKDDFGYPAYHSLHDTFHYVKTFIDSEFHVHRTIAQVMIHSTLAVADNVLLPMNTSKYADKLSFGVNHLAQNFAKVLNKFNTTLEYLEEAIKKFTRAAARLEQDKGRVHENEILKVRALNDKTMMLEKGFISQTQGNQQVRHVIFGLDYRNSYKTVQFPGLFNALMKEPQNKDEIGEQMNVLITHIENAANYLKSA